MQHGATPDGADTPAALLGPVSFGLGLAAAAGLWPPLTFYLFPVMLICGALAFALGLAGIHYAFRGIGRMWMAATGALLGALGFAWPVFLFTQVYWM
ncbi:hypothetical protein [Streptomyces sp. NPDC048191]|uniref:hypothetical protein n=1 Tax=Streptomyces sp. NPDC048191 TaxID=3155484 RepID=UPI0033D8C501